MLFFLYKSNMLKYPATSVLVISKKSSRVYIQCQIQGILEMLTVESIMLTYYRLFFIVIIIVNLDYYMNMRFVSQL